MNNEDEVNQLLARRKQLRTNIERLHSELVAQECRLMRWKKQAKVMMEGCSKEQRERIKKELFM